MNKTNGIFKIDEKLAKKVLKKKREYNRKASEYYKKGDKVSGDKWAKKSRDIYVKNYNKIFRRKK